MSSMLNNVSFDNKTRHSMLAEIRALASKMQNEPDDTDKMLDCLDKILNITWAMDKDIEQSEDTESSLWVNVKDDLPPKGKDILFSTISGQVFEGYLETKDTTRPQIDKDTGKIWFHDQKDGGQWYRYRFCDLISMNLVTAWRYKPKSYDHHKKNVADK